MLDEIFNINSFNIYSDNEYYYFFRALNMADNSDLENGIILNQNQEIERIRTNLERFDATPKYSPEDEITLEEVIEHIKMHQRKDTNCISLTSNANTALTYGRGNYKDRYVMVKIPKEEIGKKVYQAGLYIIKEINRRLNELIESRQLEDYDMQKYFFDAIDNAVTQERLDEIKRMLPKKLPQESVLEFEKGLEFDITTSKNYLSLNGLQNLEKNKVVLKLDVLNKRLLSNMSNDFLIQTLGNAFSSLELVHYKEIPKEKIVELPKEIVDILGLLQQIPTNIKYLDEIKEKVISNAITKVDVEYDYKDFNVVEKDFTLDNMYNLTKGLIDYKSALTIFQKSFYLAKSRLRTKNSVELLRKILNNESKYQEILEYMFHNTYGIEPEITTKLSNNLLQVSESVSLQFNKSERKLVEFINNLSYEELENILNKPQETLAFLMLNFLDDKEVLFDSKEDWYANSIIDLFDFKSLGVKENLSATQREDIINSLKENSFLDIYYELKRQGISEKEISYKLFAKLIKGNELEKFNIEELEWFIGYNRVKGTDLQLRFYQKDALENINRIFSDKQFASAILPTGTGKSYLAIAKMLEHKDENMLYLAPNVEILNQLQQIIINTLDSEKHLGDTSSEIVKRIFPNLTLSTYQNLRETNNIISSEYDLIIFDELHRTGASEWKKHVNELLNHQNKYTKVLGITATPERDVDLKDMTEFWAKYYGYTDEEILLGKHIAINMDIVEAIKLGIVANPKVVNCEYTLLNDEYLEDLKISIDSIVDENIKEEHLKKYEALRKQVANSSGIEKILHDNLMSNGKYIVFLPITKKEDGTYEDEDGNKVDKSDAERIIKDYQTLFKQYIFSYNYLEQEGLEIFDIYEKLKNNMPLTKNELSYLEKEKNNILLLAKINIKGKSKVLNVDSNILADTIIQYMDWDLLPKEIQAKNLSIKTNGLLESFSMLGSYSSTKNASNLREFNKEVTNKMKLMFVMNKLNEGVHANGINGIIWLRALDENSKILYLQQLGRCISAVKPAQMFKEKDRPIVLDLVNNTLKVKLDKGELKEQKDLNKLLLIKNWIILNKRIPNAESSLQIEKEYALSLYHIYNSYIKYVDNNNLLNELNVKTKLLVEEIINVGTHIDLWNLDLQKEETIISKSIGNKSSNELLDIFEIKGVISDFVELEESVNQYYIPEYNVINWVKNLIEYCNKFNEWPKERENSKICSDGTTAPQLYRWLKKSGYNKGIFKYSDIKYEDGRTLLEVMDELSEKYGRINIFEDKSKIQWVNSLIEYCEKYGEWPMRKENPKSINNGITSNQLYDWLYSSGYIKNEFKYTDIKYEDGRTLLEVIDDLKKKYGRVNNRVDEIKIQWAKKLIEYCEKYEEWPEAESKEKICSDGTSSYQLYCWLNGAGYIRGNFKYADIKYEDGRTLLEVIDDLKQKYGKVKISSDEIRIQWVKRLIEYCEKYGSWPKCNEKIKKCSDGTSSDSIYNWLRKSGYNKGIFKYKDIIYGDGHTLLEVIDELYQKYYGKTKSEFEEAKQDFDEVSKFSEIVEVKLEENINGRTTL